MSTSLLGSYRTLVEALAAAPASAPFATWWTAGEETAITFGAFLDRAARFATLYRAAGVRAGGTVVLLLAPGLELMAAFAGALLAGAVPTILAPPTFKIEPEKYRRGLSGVTANLAASLVVLDAGFPDALAECVKGAVTLRVAEAPAAPLDRAEWATPSPDDVAFIQHSSGTTGLQKGVALSHRMVLTHLAAVATSLRLAPGDRIVTWAPLYHDLGLIACFLLPLVAHLPLVAQSPTEWVTDPGSFLRLISRHRGTLCLQPNFAFSFLARRVREEDRAELDLSSLRAVINCAEPVRGESMDEFFAVYGPRGLARSALHTMYGLAEAVMAVTHSVPDGIATLLVDRDALVRSGRAVPVPPSTAGARLLLSSGRCLPGTRVRVLGPDGATRPDGHVGSIVIETAALFSGYYNRPDLTLARLRGGVLRTGDTGFLWREELFVLGREDDVIIVAGDNVYPEDVEAAAGTHPDVRDGRVIAFGVLNEELGTQDLVVVAEVDPRVLAARKPAIEAAIRRAITGATGRPPRVVEAVPSGWIIKSTAGKPARRETREKFLRAREIR